MKFVEKCYDVLEMFKFCVMFVSTAQMKIYI